MTGFAGQWVAAARGTEDGKAVRLFRALLGVVVVRDLLCMNVPYRLFASPNTFRTPYLEGWPQIPMTPLAPYLAALLSTLAFLCAFALMAASRRRLPTLFLATLYGQVFLSDKAFYTNNGYILLLFLLGASLEAPGNPMPAYPRTLLRVLVSTIYGCAVVTKLSWPWLSGTILEASLLKYGTVWPQYVSDTVPHGVAVALAIGTIGVEVLLAIGLWFRRTRPIVIGIGIAFHVGIEVLLPVRMFSWLMIASYALFLSSEELAVFERWLPTSRVFRTLAGAGTGVGLAAALCAILPYRLAPEQWLPFTVALSVGVAWLVVTGRRRVWDDGRVRTLLPTPFRPAFCAVLLGALLASVVRPAFGATDRFAFRMFKEVIVVAPRLYVRRGDQWVEGPLVGALHLWPGRRRGEAYYRWDSWSEEEDLLQSYADWIATQPGIDEARVDVRFALNHGKTQSAVFESPAPRGHAASQRPESFRQLPTHNAKTRIAHDPARSGTP